MMPNNNFFSFFSGGTKNRELQDTRESWERTQQQWKASPLAALDMEAFASEIVREAMVDAERVPAPPVIAALCEATEALLKAEGIGDIEPLWAAIENSVEVAIEFREMLVRRARWAASYGHLRKAFATKLAAIYRELLENLPEACFGEWGGDASETFDVPLLDLLEKPVHVIERLLQFPFANDVLSLDLFSELRKFFNLNLLEASGIAPTAQFAAGKEPRLVLPSAQSGKSAGELCDLYLSGTPLATFLELPIPFSIPDETRFEHCHIVAGTGHGKTQLLQKMIHADLVASQYDNRAVVVLDSQGDLIRKLTNLELFSPYVKDGLSDRLVLINAADVEFPIAMNLFDAHLERLKGYSPADRERVLNGVVELYETFFDALLGAELTQRQDVVFRYIARLMLTIPGATIHTFMELMDDGRQFKPYMDKLEGSAKRFFDTEFFSPSFSATKGQVSKRLWGVLSTPAFDRMFSQKQNKVDLFQALNSGKIVLVNTAKDMLKDEGCRLFGRFFMAMLVQATLERSTVREGDRNPTFVYVDEAHEYFDDRIETVLNQARKFKVSLTLAHQNLDQLSLRLRAALLTNTTMKCAGGVSAKDSRALADELHTTTEFIDGMRKRGPKTEFAVWVKHLTPHAIRLSVPLGFLERQYTLNEEDYDLLMDENRKRYCGTLDAVTVSEPSISPTPLHKVERPVERAEQPARAPAFERTSEPKPLAPEQRELGKGGPRHKYLQSLVKELASQYGMKATIEAPLADGTGLIDVLVEHGEMAIAIEISVSTPIEHERLNLQRCLAAGYPHVAVILAKSRTTQARYATSLLEGVAEADRKRVSLLMPEEIPAYIASLAPARPKSEKIVRGYKVRVSHEAATPEEVRERQLAVAKIIARSLGNG